MLLLLVYSVLLVHFIRSQELTNNQKCFYRCTASCVGSGQNSGFCEEECSSYNNINLCNSSDCWSFCRDLGPPTSLTAPSGIHTTNDNGTRGVRWSPVSLAGAYLVQLKEQSDPDFSTSPIEVTGNTSLEDVLVQRNAFCDPMDVRVASASKTSVSGFSEVKKVDKPKPGASPKLLLKELKYLNRPFVDDFYEANGTIQITFEYKPYEWTLGDSDLQIEPMFHMITCSDPDLSQGVPIPQFAPGPEPNTVVGFVGSDMMYRKCRFVYYVQEVRSKTCGTNTFFHSPPPDALQTMNIECGTVLNNPCVIEERHEPPVCGQVEDITYKIMNDDVDSDDVSRNLTVNVTFVPMMRTREAPTLYYVAFYGIAMNYKSKEEEAFLGVNITKMLGRVSNCKSLTSAGLCAHETTNDVFLEEMHLDTLYGITFCAVKDPKNLTFPDFLADSRQRRPKANRIYLDGKYIHRRRARNAKTTNKTTTKTPVSHATTTKTTTLPVSTQTTKKSSKVVSEAPAKTNTTAKPTTEPMTTKTSIPITVNSTAKTLAKTKPTKKVPKSTPTSKRTTKPSAKKETTTKSSKRPATSRKTPPTKKTTEKSIKSVAEGSETNKSRKTSSTNTSSKVTALPKTSETTTKQSTSRLEKPKESGEEVSDQTTKTSRTKTTSKAAETTTKQYTTKLAKESGKEISHSATKTTPKVTASPKTTEITTARTTTTTSAKPKDCEEKVSKLQKSKGKSKTSTTSKTPVTKTKSNTTTKQPTSKPTTEKSTTKSTTQQSTNETSAKQSTSKPTTKQSSVKTSTRKPTTEATTQKSTSKTSTEIPSSKSTTKNSTSESTTQKSTSGTLTKKSSSKSTTKNSTSESTTQKSTSKTPTKKSTSESTTRKTTSKPTTTSSTTPTTTKTTKQKTTHPPKTNAKIEQTSIELTTEVSQTEALKAKPAPKKTTKRRKTTVQPTKSIPITTKKPVKTTTTENKESTTEQSSPSTQKTNKIFFISKTNTTDPVNVKIGSKPGRAALPMHPTNRKSTTTKTTSVRKSPIEDGGIIELMSRSELLTFSGFHGYKVVQKILIDHVWRRRCTYNVPERKSKLSMVGKRNMLE